MGPLVSHRSKIGVWYSVVMPTTKGDVVVNARLDSDTLGRLDELADEMQRTRSFLIAQAVRDFVEREYAFLTAVREGDADVEAGRTLSHEQALAWAKSLKARRISDAPAFLSKKRRRA